ncbi:hypothetical protein D3C71_1594650 [compost metagenome]
MGCRLGLPELHVAAVADAPFQALHDCPAELAEICVAQRGERIAFAAQCSVHSGVIKVAEHQLPNEHLRGVVRCLWHRAMA